MSRAERLRDMEQSALAVCRINPDAVHDVVWLVDRLAERSARDPGTGSSTHG